MARNKGSIAEELLDLVALLPWWVGVALALLFFVFLHAVATSPVASGVPPGHLAEATVQAIWRGAASVGQYVLPLLCFAGAAVSAWRRQARRALMAHAASGTGPQVVDGMTWQEFEMLVGEAFRRQGYAVREMGGGGADGGIDLELRKGSEKFLVQCKQWRAYQVSVQVVRELYGVMAAKGAAGGFVVTSGRFTEEAMAFARGSNVKLIDGRELGTWIATAKVALNKQTVRLPAKAAPAAQDGAGPPACPACGKPMLRRTAKRGAHAGNEFWGCSTYPACKGTRQMQRG